MTNFTEYQKLSEDRQTLAIYQTIWTESELSGFVDFEPSDGNAHSYDRETTLPVTDLYGDESDFSESSPTYTEATTTLKTMAIQSPMNNKTTALARVKDPLAALKFSMAKSWARKFEDKLINGDNNANGNDFDGLIRKAVAETRMMAMDDGNVDGPGTAETELTLDRLDEMIDQVQNGKPAVLIMNKTMRRKLKRLMYAAGGGIQLESVEAFGRTMSAYDGIPIAISDYLSNAEQYNDSGTWGSSTATTIFAMRFGEANGGGYSLIHNGPVLNPEFIELGQRKSNNEKVYRMIAYLGSYLPSPLSMIGLGGIDSAA